jgi:hypothetical protein
MQIAALSSLEMSETEGAVLWFKPVVIKFGPHAMRIAHHAAHHAFWGRKLPHLQVNTWRQGVPGSGKTLFRIPLPNTGFFRP